jgi:uncharacterized membrane-anchored protein YjiN (DUF445 family)
MVDITIVNGVYKPTYNWGAPSCIDAYRKAFEMQKQLSVVKLWGASTNAQMVAEMPMKRDGRIHAQLTEWTNESMIQWITDSMMSMNQPIHESVNHWVNESPNSWIKDLTMHCTHESMIQRFTELMNQWFNGSMNQRISESLDRWINCSKISWINESIEQWITESMHFPTKNPQIKCSDPYFFWSVLLI